MSIILNKGQMFPKWLTGNNLICHNKVRHTVVAGCKLELSKCGDVLKVKALEPTGAMFHSKTGATIKRKNGTRQFMGVTLLNIHGETYEYKDELHQKAQVTK